MKNIILSGYSVNQFKKVLNKGKKPGCYFCKRMPGEKGMYAVIEDGEENVGTQKLEFKAFEVVREGRTFLYPVCHECLIILEHLAEGQGHSPIKGLFDRPSLN